MFLCSLKSVPCGDHSKTDWLQMLMSGRRTYSDYFLKDSLKSVQTFMKYFANGVESKLELKILRNLLAHRIWFGDQFQYLHTKLKLNVGETGWIEAIFVGFF